MLIRMLALCTFVTIFAANTFARDDISTLNQATKVLNEILEIPDKTIPQSLLDQAEAIAVIPDVVKAALTLGGKYGRGVISVKTEGGEWTSPIFVRIAGGSIGAQIGVESTDLILLFQSREAIEEIAKGDFTIGATASVAAGPVGRQAGAATNYKFDAEILSYSRSKGLFAGIALDGSSLKVDRESNANVYGEQISTEQLIKGTNANPPKEAESFTNTIDKRTK